MTRVCSLFAGMGGMCAAAVQAGCEIVYANEFDKFACRTYRHNFEKHFLEEGDVWDVDLSNVPDHDLLMAGFPCQAFSVAGRRDGFNDERGQLFFRILDFIDEKRPDMILLENVQNLLTHDKGRTFKRIRKEITTERDYWMDYEILNSKDYVPQNRPRIFMVCVKRGICDLLFPKYEFPRPEKKRPSLSSIVDFEQEQDEKYYLSSKSKYYELFSEIEKGKTYQLRRYYVRENKSGLCPTLTANMGGGGHNVPFVRDSRGVRKLTEYECLRLQGFPEDFDFPEDMGLSHRYKQIGNSVTVPLVRDIIRSQVKFVRKPAYHANEGSRK